MKKFKVTFCRTYEVDYQEVSDRTTMDDLMSDNLEETQKCIAEEIARDWLSNEMGFFDIKDFVSATVEVIEDKLSNQEEL